MIQLYFQISVLPPPLFYSAEFSNNSVIIILVSNLSERSMGNIISKDNNQASVPNSF
jgi:hypothetical protein